MHEEVSSPALTLLFAASGMSLVTLFVLFQKHVSGRALLTYQPRRRVPWGAGVALLAIAMPMVGVVAYLASGESTADEPAATEASQEQNDADEQSDESNAPEDESTESEPTTEELLVSGWGNFVFMLMFVLCVATWLISFLHADAQDLGLPTSWRQLLGDIGIGIVATLAAFLPVYFIQLLLLFAFQSETAHPLVEQMSEHQSPGMLTLGFAMAVIAAPIFEEFTFRGLLQGWLERCEDEVLAFNATRREPETVLASLDEVNEIDLVSQVMAQKIPLTETQNRPARGWLADLPHGWTPILISGTTFGLAHLGHGVAPVALVLFGIVLGYLYQRTHRLAPCITAHMLFNGYAMLQLWLQLGNMPAG